MPVVTAPCALICRNSSIRAHSVVLQREREFTVAVTAAVQFPFHQEKQRSAALHPLPLSLSLPAMLDITMARFELLPPPLPPPAYARHRHLPVTLSDTFSASVLLQLPPSAATLPPIWPCHKTRGDRFGALQSRSRPTE